MAVTDEAAKAPEPELLRDLCDHAVDVLSTQLGLPPDTAEAGAKAIVERIRKTYGGLQLYIPTGRSIDLAERDMEIYKAFNGNNYEQLMRDYGLTIHSIYRALRRARAIIRAQR